MSDPTKPPLPNVPMNEQQFKRSISPEDYARMDPKTKEQLARARHTGIIRSSYEALVGQLHEAITKPRSGPAGEVLPPLRLDEVVGVLMHRDDLIVPPPMRDSWREQNIEVGAFIGERAQLAEGLKTFVHDPTGTRPYFDAGRALAQEPPPNGFYVAVFDLNVATVTVFYPEADAPGEPAAPGDPATSAAPAGEPPPSVPTPP